MKRLVFIVVGLMVLVGFPASAQATQGVAKKFTSCEKLLAQYPNGVAQSAKARNKAVREGFARAKVSKSLYKTNGARLDRDKDGVMCEQEAAPAESAPAAPESADSGVIYFPTGLALIDAIYGNKAKNGELSQQQANFMLAYTRTIAQQSVSNLCGGWKSQTFQNGVLDQIAVPAVAASSDLPGQEAWIREIAGLITSTWCVSRGYNYSVMLP